MKPILAAIALVTLALCSDTISFDPSLYQPIDYERRALELSPGLSIIGNSKHFLNGKDFYNSEFSDDNLNQDLKGRLSVDAKYSNDLENETRLVFTKLGGMFSFEKQGTSYESVDSQFVNSFVSLEDNMSKTVTAGTGFNINASQDRSRYLTSDKFFLSAKYGLNTRHSYAREEGRSKSSSKDILSDYSSIVTNENDSWSKRSQIIVAPDLTIGLGWGRVHDVTYSAVAAHILYDLEEGDVNHEKILALATLLEKLKRERILDSRESHIEHLTQISKWLMENEVLESYDPKALFTMEDYWLYAFDQHRAKGGRFSIGAGTRYKLYFTKDEIHSTNEITRYFQDSITSSYQSENEAGTIKRDVLNDFNFSGDMKYEYYKPVSMRSQFSFAASIEGGYWLIYTKDSVENTTPEEEYNYYNPAGCEKDTISQFWGRGSLSLRYRIFPSVRSNIQFSCSTSYSKKYFKDDDIEDNSYNHSTEDYMNNDFVAAMLAARWYYYFSPNFSCSMGGGYHYGFTKDHAAQDKNHTHELDAGIRFTYKIF